MGRGRLVGEKPKLSRMERSILGIEARRGQQLKSQPEWMESKVGIGRIKRLRIRFRRITLSPPRRRLGHVQRRAWELL